MREDANEYPDARILGLTHYKRVNRLTILLRTLSGVLALLGAAHIPDLLSENWSMARAISTTLIALIASAHAFFDGAVIKQLADKTASLFVQSLKTRINEIKACFLASNQEGDSFEVSTATSVSIVVLVALLVKNNFDTSYVFNGIFHDGYALAIFVPFSAVKLLDWMGCVFRVLANICISSMFFYILHGMTTSHIIPLWMGLAASIPALSIQIIPAKGRNHLWIANWAFLEVVRAPYTIPMVIGKVSIILMFSPIYAWSLIESKMKGERSFAVMLATAYGLYMVFTSSFYP